MKRIQDVFHRVGFIHSKDQIVAAILEEDEEKGVPEFVMHESTSQNWIAVDVPSVIHMSK